MSTRPRLVKILTIAVSLASSRVKRWSRCQEEQSTFQRKRPRWTRRGAAACANTRRVHTGQTAKLFSIYYDFIPGAAAPGKKKMMLMLMVLMMLMMMMIGELMVGSSRR